MQSYFNQEALDFCLALQEHLKYLKTTREINNFWAVFLNKAMSSRIALDQMNEKQLILFQTNILDRLKYNEEK